MANMRRSRTGDWSVVIGPGPTVHFCLHIFVQVLRNIPLRVELLGRIFMRYRSGTFRDRHEKFHWPCNITGYECK